MFVRERDWEILRVQQSPGQKHCGWVVMFSSVFVVDGREGDWVRMMMRMRGRMISGCGGPGSYRDTRMSQWLMV